MDPQALASRVCYDGTCRRQPDGSVLMVRYSKKAEEELDRLMFRDPRSQQWYPGPVGDEELFAITLRPGEEVTVYAKGPSIDKFPFSQQVGPSFCINESALVVPKADYMIALDANVFQVCRLKLRKECVGIAQLGNHEARFIPKRAWFVWGRDCTPGYETAPALLELLGKMGVKKVLAVGFDSYPHGQAGKQIYAKSVEKTGAKLRDNDDYAPICRHIDEVITRSGLVVDWWHLRDAPATRTHSASTPGAGVPSPGRSTRASTLKRVGRAHRRTS